MFESEIQQNIQTIGYPVAILSGAKGSSETPENYEKFLHPYLSDPKAHGIKADYKVNKEFLMVHGNNQPSEKKHGINNYDSAVESLTELGNAIGKAQWQGDKSLTIGGDHSQGFATVKVTLLVEVLKAVKDGRIKSDEKDKLALLKLADEGKFDKVGARLDEIVNAGGIKLENIKAFTYKISTIWIDAHGDYNTPETSPSGNFHGMSSAAAHGEKVGGIEELFGKSIAADPKNLYVLCERDLDPEEKDLMTKRGINFGYQVKTSRSSKKLPPLKEVLDSVIKEIVDKGNEFILSVDVDHIRAKRVPETGTDVINGPESSDSYKALSRKLRHPKCKGGDITEIGTKKGKKRGTRTSETGFKMGTSMVAGEDQINVIGEAMTKEGVRTAFVDSIMKEGR